MQHLAGEGPKIQWVESYVTDVKVYCVYIAPDEATIREHTAKGGFPANKVSQVRSVIDPTTADVAERPGVKQQIPFGNDKARAVRYSCVVVAGIVDLSASLLER